MNFSVVEKKKRRLPKVGEVFQYSDNIFLRIDGKQGKRMTNYNSQIFVIWLSSYSSFRRGMIDGFSDVSIEVLDVLKPINDGKIFEEQKQ